MHVSFFRSALAGLGMALALVAVMLGWSAPGLASDGKKAGESDGCLLAPFEITKVIDERTLYVEDVRGHGALLTMSGACLSRGSAVGLRLFVSDRLCRPGDVEITGNAMSPAPSRCLVASIHRVSPEDARKLK